MPNSPHQADIYAGSKLRLQRQIRNLSQTELARALGVTFQQVQKYEKGVNRISASRLQTICRFLDVPVSFFFENGGSLPNDTTNGEAGNSTTAVYLASKDGVALNRHFVAIKDANQRRALISLVKALAEMDHTSTHHMLLEPEAAD